MVRRTLKSVPADFSHLRPGDVVPFNTFDQIAADMSAFEVASAQAAERGAFLRHNPTGYCTNTPDGARRLAIEAAFHLGRGRARSSRRNGMLSPGKPRKELTDELSARDLDRIGRMWLDKKKFRTNPEALLAIVAAGYSVSASWLVDRFGSTGRRPQSKKR